MRKLVASAIALAASAFVAVARQAAPAAALLAAYGMLPSRSSGLKSGRRSKTIKRGSRHH
ncbi:MAG: hypothetical protein EBY22_14780 [Gammaproteobacteria bacterium]|nr:hypothetical protein [Gammaproteobacteria bacterium]